jgi:hypothetical protein
MGVRGNTQRNVAIVTQLVTHLLDQGLGRWSQLLEVFLAGLRRHQDGVLHT